MLVAVQAEILAIKHIRAESAALVAGLFRIKKRRAAHIVSETENVGCFIATHKPSRAISLLRSLRPSRLRKFPALLHSAIT